MLASVAGATDSADISNATDSSTDLNLPCVDAQLPDGEWLTQAEKAALLDEALLDAVNRPDCRAISQGAGVSGAENAGAPDTGNSNGSPVGGWQSALAAGQQAVSASGAAAAINPASSVQSTPAQQQSGNVGPGVHLPHGDKEIPKRRGNSDHIIAAQIRQLAENEPDATIKERLWEEYRRYTGKL
ncbi:MAG: hypothetical protein ACR2PW_07720 [Gammaproteobacteria bacterium]